MAVKKYNPMTPGTRFRVGNAYTEVTTDKPEKSLLAPLKKSGGRNSSGRMTVRQRGGGHKRRYRLIDFKRNKDGCSQRSKVLSTTRTVRPSSLSWNTKTAKSAISSLPTGCRLVTRSNQERMLLPIRGTHCSCAMYPLVLVSTRLNFIRGKLRQWRAALERAQP